MFSGLFLLYSVKQKYNATVTSFIFRGINSSIGKLCSTQRSKTCWNYAEKKRRMTPTLSVLPSFDQATISCIFLWKVGNTESFLKENNFAYYLHVTIVHENTL